MSTALRERPAAPPPASGAKNGGMPARRAVTRWAWRLFRREWRQQLLVLALITVAVAATIIGAAAATNNPPPKNAGFGTARNMATFQAPDPHLAGQIAALQQRFHPIDVIENQTVAIPGSINTYQLRAQNPHGPYGQPMLSLVSGHFPTGAGQVAVTSGVASDFGLRIGSVWHQGGTARTVVGIVQNPQSLLDEFALVAPGQVHNPTQVTVLFDGSGRPPAAVAHDITAAGSQTQANVVNPESISVAGLVVGMLLIALVAVGGFTVLAQRRLRSLGMLASTGATDRHVRLVVLANGAVVGIAGAFLGLVLGLAGWLAYRPVLEQSAHHLIGMFALPWGVIGLALLLAVVAAVFAAWLPARAITKVPIVTALSGRPAPPKQVRRSAIPGLVLLVIAFILFGLSGASANGNGRPAEAGTRPDRAYRGGDPAGPVLPGRAGPAGQPDPDLGAPGPAGPVPLPGPVRLGARRDQHRHPDSRDHLGGHGGTVRERARLRRAEPGLEPAHRLHAQRPGRRTGRPRAEHGARLDAVAVGQGARHRHRPRLPGRRRTRGHGRQPQPQRGRPQLVRAAVRGHPAVAACLRDHEFGVQSHGRHTQHAAWAVRPVQHATQLRQPQGPRRPGSGPGPGQNPTSFPCPRGSCLANPVIQEVSALPSGTSAPNTVITEHAVRTLHLQTGPDNADGWLIQTANPLTSAQIHNAQVAAAAANMSVETRTSVPTSATIVNWATVFGIGLALAILAMSVGLIRSETASDLRTLAATGASGRTRRNITAATAGALGFTGAVLGTVGGYVGTAGWFRTNSLNGGLTAIFTTVPVTNLLIILIGMPLVAAIGGWIFAGRQPRDLGHQPLE